MASSDPEVNKRNIMTINEYSKATRGMVRDLQKALMKLEAKFEALRVENQKLSEQVKSLQVKAFSGGATSGNHN